MKTDVNDTRSTVLIRTLSLLSCPPAPCSLPLPTRRHHVPCRARAPPTGSPFADPSPFSEPPEAMPAQRPPYTSSRSTPSPRKQSTSDVRKCGLAGVVVRGVCVHVGMLLLSRGVFLSRWDVYLFMITPCFWSWHPIGDSTRFELFNGDEIRWGGRWAASSDRET